MANSDYASVILFSLLLSFPTSIDGLPSHMPKLASMEQWEEIMAPPDSTASSSSSPFMSPAPSPPPPTTFFEITRPISVPKSKPCSVVLLQHDFGNTYGNPPVTTPYSPPHHCFIGGSDGGEPSRIVLRWVATSHGRQFDRIFGVWLGGVELLRSCTAEPRPNGIQWRVEKDVTRYAAAFSKPATLAVYLANIVDGTYTGAYHVSLSVDFYFDGGEATKPPPPPGFGSPADLILHVSRNLPSNNGLWFEVKNSTTVEWSERLAIPSNTFRAVLEVYVSFHSDDEFWYTNPPNEYISENNLTGTLGNGPFREVTVWLDGDDDVVVGAVWPFTVIYTGGIDPLLWSPITGIGSFDLPSYDIELTPFLGKLLDGKPHAFGFVVTNALDVWFVDANLHLWLDPEGTRSAAELTKHEAPPCWTSQDYNFQGLDGRFATKAKREITSTGWVKSSHGNITAYTSQRLEFSSSMVIGDNGTSQAIHHRVEAYRTTSAKNPSLGLHYSEKVSQSFPLRLSMADIDLGNGSYTMAANVSLGFNEKRVTKLTSGEEKKKGEKIARTPTYAGGSLRNLQVANGVMVVEGGLVTSGVGSNRQVYTYSGSDGSYFRNASAANYKILYDESGNRCMK